MICADVGLYDSSCVLVSDVYTAELFRGLGDSISLPVFYLVGVLNPCLSDPENPPAGSAYFYQSVIVGSDGQPIAECGT